jgi:hypothetical protein
VRCRAFCATERLQLLVREGRRRQHQRQKIDERVDVARDDLRMDGHGGRRGIDRHLGAERVDAKVDLLGGHPLAAASQHAHRQARQPGLVGGLHRRPGAQRDDDGDQRHRVGRLEQRQRAAFQFEAQGGRLHARSRHAHWAASAVGAPSGTTRTMVRPPSVR